MLFSPRNSPIHLIRIHLTPIVLHLLTHPASAGGFGASGGGITRGQVRPGQGITNIRLINAVAALNGVSQGFVQVVEGQT